MGIRIPHGDIGIGRGKYTERRAVEEGILGRSRQGRTEQIEIKVLR